MKALLKTLSVLLGAAIVLAACGGAADAPGTAAPRYAAATTPGPMVQDYRDLLQRMYLAYFGRPAEPAGLAYWAEQYRATAMPSDLKNLTIAWGVNSTARTMIDYFGTSQESTDLYQGDNDVFVTAIYRNLFNRDPDPAGKAFWVTAIDTGRMTRPIAALSIMEGALSSDATIINNKLAMATRFTNAVNTPARVAAYSGLAANAVARELLATVSPASDPATFDAAIDAAFAVLLGEPPKGLYFGFLYGSLTDGASRIGLISATGGQAVPALAAATATLSTLFMQGTVSNGTIRGAHVRSMLVWKNARLVRQDLVNPDGVPANAQVSTLEASEVCSLPPSEVVASSVDLANAARAWIAFRKPGPDRLCGTGDDAFAAVRMNMGAGDAPRSIGEPLFAIHAADGAVTGWLVRNGQQVMRVDREFANPAAMFTLPASDLAYRAGTDARAKLFIFASGNTVYAWDASSTSAGAPTLVSTLAGGEFLDRLAALDQSELFMSISSQTGGAMRVLRYLPASRSTNTVGTANLGGGSVGLEITPSRVVLFNVLLGSVASLPRTGGTAQAIYAPATPAALPYVTVAGERLWLGLSSGDVIMLNSDGSDVQTARGAQMGGCIQKPSVPFALNGNGCDAMLVIRNGSMRAFDATTGAMRLSYGTITMPPEPMLSAFSVSTSSAWGQAAVLTQVNFNPANPGATTISNYFFKSDQAGLTPITLP